MSKPRRSSEKPTPRRDGVAPDAVRRRSGSRSSSSSSSVSTSPPSCSTPSRTRRSVGGELLDLFGELVGIAEQLPRRTRARARWAASRDDRGSEPAMALTVSNGACARSARRPRGSSPSQARSWTRYAVGSKSSTLPLLSARANTMPRSMSGWSAGGTACTTRLPRASAMRWSSSTLACGKPARIADVGQRDERARDLLRADRAASPRRCGCPDARRASRARPRAMP